MDELPGLLARDFGLRPQGKSAPMAPPAGSGAPPRFSQPLSSPSVDSFSATSKASSLPVYDKPVYDDDVFDGIPRMKSSTSGRHDDVFASMGSSGASAPPMGNFLESLGRSPSEAKGSLSGRFGASKKEGLAGFEGLIPGFVGSSPTQRSKSPETNYQPTSVPLSKSTSNVTNDPFVVLETSTSANSSSGLFTEPLGQISRPMSSGSTNINVSPISGRLFDDIDGFGGLKKSTPSFSSEKKENRQDESPLSTVQNVGHEDPFSDLEPHTKSSTKTSKNVPKMHPTNGYRETNHTFFQKPSKAADSFEDISRSAFSSSEAKLKPHERNATADLSTKLNEHLEAADDVWLAVSEIPLFTQPTSAPSPSRPPPPLVIKLSSSGRTSRGASVGINFKGKGRSSVNQSSQSYEQSTQNSGASPIDELEDFAMGRPPQAFANENSEFLNNEDNFERSSAAAASAAVMKEAMDKAEAKFKHAKETRERERDAKLATNREATQQERDDKTIDPWGLGYKKQEERLYREKEQRDREEKEREEKRFEKERELELERVRERERHVVGRVNRETRERAASEARLKFERVAFQRAAAEARERAERTAVEKTSAQVRERNAAQVQERHAAEVRERGASQAQEKQQNNENDLESIFGVKQSATAVENFFDAQVQSKPASDATRRSSSTSSSTIRKGSSMTNIVDDLTSVFGAPPSSRKFDEVEGENEERRRARMERHLRTHDRATKALAEMNERDVQTKWEQEERLRIAETLDSEIKRWAAGKEGNLRALLSTLQYVLWPECGWQPVSLSDLITSASVKKVYRKATLCIHPDKVQQKGANLQQKFTAEKVFDLLKEAWNKFNSEELL